MMIIAVRSSVAVAPELKSATAWRKASRICPAGSWWWARITPITRAVPNNSLALLAACASGLVMAAWLDPDAPAYGTHRTLGLGPCGFLVRTGFPCPTCGMTTSCCLTVRGRLGAAFYAQPLGRLGCLVVAATGRTWMVNWYRISPLLVVWIVGLAFILAWGIKIAVGLLDGSLPARSF